MNAFVKRLIYGKEGPDITKDEPEKRPFFKFWEIAWNKRFKLMGINLIYFVCNLLSTALAGAAYILAVSFYYTLSQGISVWDAIAASEQPQQAQVMYYMGLAFVMIFFNIVPVFSAGPFRAGLTFITQSFVKREPVFLWNDYITKTRSNLKLGIIVMLINGVAGVWIMLLVAFYMACSREGSNMAGLMPNWLLFISAAVAFFASVMFFAMNLFIYPMIVTFRITLKQLYKNAAIFALIKWLPNLGILLLMAAMTLIPLLVFNGYFAFIVSLLLYAVLGLAFTCYIETFYVYPILKKYMIDNPNADKSQAGGNGGSNNVDTGSNKASGGVDSHGNNGGSDVDSGDNNTSSSVDDSSSGDGTAPAEEKWVYPGL